MAINTKLKSLLDKMGRGVLASGSQIRASLQTAEVNVLTVTLDELTLLNKSITSGLKSTVHQERTSARELEKLVEGGTNLDDGSVNLAATTYSKLLTIGEKIGRTDKRGWHLGHAELGNLAQRMAFILQNYKVGGDRFLNNEEARLIQSAILSAQKLEKLEDDVLDQLSSIQIKDTDALVAALAGSNAGLEIDLHASSVFAKNAVTNNISIAYTFENATRNRAKGDLSRNLSTKTGKFLRNLQKKEGEALAFRMDAIWDEVLDPFSVSSSPSMVQRIIAEVTALFHGKKAKHKSKRGSILRLRRKQEAKNIQAVVLKTLIKKRLATLKTKAAAVKNKKKFIIPTVSLKALINESLALFIKTRMGESNDPAIKLRYQTGRFSESAKLLTLNRTEAGAYIGTYDFQKNPYAVFLPGERLGTQQRDPKLYIEGAMRDIAIQVLGRNFRNLNLRLV